MYMRHAFLFVFFQILWETPPLLFFFFFSFKIFIEHFYMPSPVLDTGDTMVKKSDEASLFKELLYT